MKHMRTVERPAEMRQVINYITCDLCGIKIKSRLYDVDEIEVRHKTGSSYPEGGSGVETSVDMCGACFDKKLIPWLRSQGAEPHEKDWDY